MVILNCLKITVAQDILKNSLSYTIIGFLPLSFAFVFTPIYLGYMNEEQYGMLHLFMLYSGIISQIFNLGVSHAFIYLYWDVYKDKKELKSLISSTFGLLILFQIIFIAIGLIFGESILGYLSKPDDAFTFYPYFVITLLFSAFMVYYEIFQHFFRNEGNLKMFAILGVGTLVLLTVGTLIGVVWLDLKALGAILGRTVGYGLIIIVFLFFMISKYGVSFQIKRSKAILLFGLPLFINAIVGAFAYGIDKILIKHFDTMENLGVYGLALVIISVIEIWFNSINNALSPTLYKFINESINKKKREIQGLSHIIILAVMGATVIVIALLFPALDLIIPENFHEAAFFIPILGTAFFWRVFIALEALALYREKKTNYLILNQSSSLIFTVVFGYLFYQSSGIIGIAYGVYFAKVIEYVVMKAIVTKVKKLPLRMNKFVVMSIILGLISFICTYYYDSSMNKYLLYSLPLICFLIISPFLLSSELKNVYYSLKNRKNLF